MLRILAVHNFYQHPGGEDQVFAAEAALLERHGHTVERYTEDNHRITSGVAASLSTAADAVWSRRSFQSLKTASVRADVVHFHNTFPLISPSPYYAARNAAVVQTLHNYRLICPGAALYRDSKPCESCIGRATPLPAVVHGCYRDSRAASATVAAMLSIHRAAQTWQRKVDIYIALSEFARRKFIEGGLPADRIVVKSNFVWPDPGASQRIPGDYALFVGRLSEEKGVRTLAAAWRQLAGIPLRVAGDGPLKGIAWPADVTAPGHQTRAEIIQLMRNARVLIFPSQCYENAPMSIVEALACGLPVIASDRGSIPEFVADHRTGLLFRPGDPDDLATKVRWAFSNHDELAEMRIQARREYETKYTAERNYKMLLDIYEVALDRRLVGHGLALRRSPRPPFLGSGPRPLTRESREILGVRVDATSYDAATARITQWAREQQPAYVCIAAVNNIMEARRSPEYREVMRDATLVTSDGMPLVWLLRWLGIPHATRVYGPDLTPRVLESAASQGLRVGFYGGTPEVLKKLIARMTERFPALDVAYSYAPPFRPLTPQEDAAEVRAINASGVRILFIGLGSPKQDRWMHAHRDSIPAVMLGVGAAFDFLAGAKPQAPRWMQRSGFEWLFRLASEPSRLGPRYLKQNPVFAALAVGQLLRTKFFPKFIQ